MSMSRTALKLVQKSLPQLRLCKSMLVLPPTKHILRAYHFERTPYKGAFYLWRVVAPLFRVTLNYSRRIPKGEQVHLSRDNPHESAAIVTEIVSENIGYLEEVRTPADFLNHIGWMVGNDTPKFLLDLAMTYFLVERHHEAHAAAQEASAEAEKLVRYYKGSGEGGERTAEHLEEVGLIASRLAEEIRSNPTAAAEMIAERERQNIVEFDLTDTLEEVARN